MSSLDLRQYSIRSINERDCCRLFTWRNSDHVRLYMQNTQIISETEHNAWFKRIIDDHSCRYMIFEHRGSPLGLICITDMFPDKSQAYWGFYLGEPNTPKGTGAVMGVLALDFVFNDLDISFLNSRIMKHNKISIEFHLKLGFKEKKYNHNEIINERAFIEMYNNKCNWNKYRYFVVGN